MTTSELPVTRGPWRIQIKNLRVLSEVDWSPSGVCLLAGPNGSGKSTLLRALQFPRFSYRDGRTDALQYLGGASNLRQLGASDDAPVVFEFAEGDTRWRIEVPIEGAGVHPYFGELVHSAEVVHIEARRYEGKIEYQGRIFSRTTGDQSAIRRIWPVPPPAFAPLLTRMMNVRVHYSYSLEAARQQGVGPGTPNEYLHPTGRNLWAVLRHWQDQGETAPEGALALEFVKEETRKAFPDIFADFWFDETTGEPRFRVPGQEQGLQVHLAADGLLVGLMHLTATAGARAGSILAFDEMENQLHPHAIRSILAAMRARADELDLTIILTTHSPVLMNEFKDDEESFYVLDRPAGSTAPLPTPLSTLKDPDWLRHFALGDLYDREEFAAPVSGKP